MEGVDHVDVPWHPHGCGQVAVHAAVSDGSQIGSVHGEQAFQFIRKNVEKQSPERNGRVPETSIRKGRSMADRPLRRKRPSSEGRIQPALGLCQSLVRSPEDPIVQRQRKGERRDGEVGRRQGRQGATAGILHSRLHPVLSRAHDRRLLLVPDTPDPLMADQHTQGPLHSNVQPMEATGFGGPVIPQRLFANDGTERDTRTDLAVPEPPRIRTNAHEVFELGLVPHSSTREHHRGDPTPVVTGNVTWMRDSGITTADATVANPVTTIGGIEVVDAAGSVHWKQAKQRGRPRAPSSNQRAQRMDLPLHVKEVKTLNMSKFEKILSPIERLVWDEISIFIKSETYLEQLARDGRKRKVVTSLFSQQDVVAMQEAGVATRVPASDDLVYSNTFSVDETAKRRRRAINHVAQLNDTAPVATIRLPGLRELKAACAGADHAFCADAQSWYYQIEIPEHLRRFFAFKSGDESYVLNRLPMGASFACAIGHFITTIVANLAAKGLSRVQVLTYIDNYCFLGNKRDLETARRNLRRITQTLGITVNEEEISHKFDFIGFTVDLTDRTLTNSEKTISKCLEVVPESCTTRRQILGMFGRLLSCLRIHPWALTQSFYVLKFHRRISAESAQHGLDEARTIWPCLTRKLMYLRRVVSSRIQESLDIPHEVDAVIASDASDVGIGWSVCTQNGVSNTSRRLTPAEEKLPIHVREAIALYESLRRIRRSRIFILTDNACLYWGLMNGYSRSYLLNVWLDRITTAVRQLQLTVIGVSWIDSAHNPADAPSRLAPTDDSLWQTVSLIPRRPGEYGFSL